MQTNGCNQHNGLTPTESTSTGSQLNGSHHRETNGQLTEDSENAIKFSLMSTADQDIVRLIGQHLRSLGLK